MPGPETHHGRHHPSLLGVALDLVVAVLRNGLDGEEVEVHVGAALEEEDDDAADVGDGVGVGVHQVVVSAGEGILSWSTGG